MFESLSDEELLIFVFCIQKGVIGLANISHAFDGCLFGIGHLTTKEVRERVCALKKGFFDEADKRGLAFSHS